MRKKKKKSYDFSDLLDPTKTHCVLRNANYASVRACICKWRKDTLGLDDELSRAGVKRFYYVIDDTTIYVFKEKPEGYAKAQYGSVKAAKMAEDVRRRYAQRKKRGAANAKKPPEAFQRPAKGFKAK